MQMFTGDRSRVSQRFIEEMETMKDENLLSQQSVKRSNNKSQCTALKGTMEYDLPELVVFLQEESYHFVKDICVDNEKCLVENCELDHKIISCILESDGSDEIKRDTRSQNTSEVDDDERCNKKINKEIVPESLHLVGEVQKSVLTSTTVPLTIVEKSDESRQITTTIIVPEEAEMRRISCCSDSSMSSKSGAEELLLGPDSHQQDPYAGPVPTSLESQQSFKDEASLFGSGHLSGLITHHGIAAPSFRSTSHLSNSSTTSSRSFAFPVLAAEWHGSPDRMAKSENRKFGKRKGKCARFLCCKF